MRRVAAGLALVLASCAPAETGACPPVPLDELDARLAAQFCECVPELASWVLGYEPSDCVGAMTASLAEGQIGHLRADVAAGTVRYDPAEAGLALCRLCELEDTYRLGVGHSPDGGPCAFDFDCGAASVCQTGHGCGGTCVHLPQSGDACASDSDCHHPTALAVPSLWCPHGSCEPVPGLGQTCTFSCAAGLACQTPTGMAGTCVERAPPRALGEACGPVGCPPGFSSCASIHCGRGLVCVDVGPGAIPTCQAPLTDGTCRAVYDHQGSDCPAGYACTGQSVGVTGRCTPPPGEAEACASTLTTCAEELRCEGATLTTGGTCGPVGHLGDRCVDDERCVSRFCDAGHCATVPACP